MSNALTEPKFWNSYWAGLSLPSTIDKSFSFDRCLASKLNEIGASFSTDQPSDGKRKSVIEIGAAPGKWLTIFAALGMEVSGIEYSQEGIRYLRDNMSMLGVVPRELIEADFFLIEPRCEFNIVMSFGFVEHFKDVETVILRQSEWLLPGGILIIGVPNFRGLHGIIQRVLDRAVLDYHNTAIMRRGYFESLSGKHNLRLKSLDFIGSFEPALPMTTSPKKVGALLIRSFLKVLSFFRKIRFFDRFNSPFFSSYILVTYTKERE